MTKKISAGEKFYTEFMLPWPSAFSWNKLDKDVQDYWERQAKKKLKEEEKDDKSS
jgi:hypothetical protein